MTGAAAPTGGAPRWLLCRRRRPDAPVRLYCLPHSGGSAGEYLRWGDQLPGVEVWGVQLPGHGGRSTEPPLTTMDDLVAGIVSGTRFEPPYALFGHSLGAIAAFEVARELRRRGRPGPGRLFLSAYGAPHLHRPGPPVHELAEPDLIAALEREYGALPDEVHADPELRSLVLTGLRADLAVVAGYRFRPGPPLEVPITVIGGLDDEETPDRLAAWSDYTTAGVDLHLVAGDHFYFRKDPDAVLALLADPLARRAAGTLRRPAPLGSAPAGA